MVSIFHSGCFWNPKRTVYGTPYHPFSTPWKIQGFYRPPWVPGDMKRSSQPPVLVSVQVLVMPSWWKLGKSWIMKKQFEWSRSAESFKRHWLEIFQVLSWDTRATLWIMRMFCQKMDLLRSQNQVQLVPPGTPPSNSGSVLFGDLGGGALSHGPGRFAPYRHGRGDLDGMDWKVNTDTTSLSQDFPVKVI